MRGLGPKGPLSGVPHPLISSPATGLSVPEDGTPAIGFNFKLKHCVSTVTNESRSFPTTTLACPGTKSYCLLIEYIQRKWLNSIRLRVNGV